MHSLKFSIFPPKRKSREEIQWEKCWHVWQSFNECGYCDTSGFHKHRPYIISPLISLQSVFILSASVDRKAPFLKENQQLQCIGWKSNRSDFWPPITPSPGCTETRNYPCRAKSPRNYFQNWRIHERLSDKSISSLPRFSPEMKLSLDSHEECSKVFLENSKRPFVTAHESTIRPRNLI